MIDMRDTPYSFLSDGASLCQALPLALVTLHATYLYTIL